MMRSRGAVLLSPISGFIDISFRFPARLILRIAGPEEAKNRAGKYPPLDSDPFSDVESEKISPARQAQFAGK
jgi:hypothetical protein